MTRRPRAVVKFGVFAVVMVVLIGSLIVIFGQYRTGSTNAYSAVFRDVSGLKPGDSVRAAGLRVGTVDDVAMQPDNTVVVTFDADRDVVLTTGTKVAVRYLNLVGDRYLELVDGPGSTRFLPAGSRIPTDRTEPALDLDLLLGGLETRHRGTQSAGRQRADGVAAAGVPRPGRHAGLAAVAVRVVLQRAGRQRPGDRAADRQPEHSGGHARQGRRQVLRRHRRLRAARHRSLRRTATRSVPPSTRLSNGTASLADLLDQRATAAGGHRDQLGRLAPLLDDDKELLDTALQRAPDNYRKLVRLGAYGSWFNYYICGLSFRVDRSAGPHRGLPLVKQDDGKVR